MKNKELILIIFGAIILQLIVPNSYAELKQVKSSLNLTIDGTTLTVRGITLNFEKTLNVDNYSIEHYYTELSDSWYENLTCSIEYEIGDVKSKIDNMSWYVGSLNDDFRFYDDYTDCFVNKSSLQNYRDTNEEFKLLYESCMSSKSNSDIDSVNWKNRATAYNESLYSLRQDYDNVAGQRVLSVIWGIVGTILSGFMIWKYKRPYGKRGEDPSAKDNRGLETVR